MSGDSDGDLKATLMPEEAMGGKQPRTACTMPWMMMGSNHCTPKISSAGMQMAESRVLKLAGCVLPLRLQARQSLLQLVGEHHLCFMSAVTNLAVPCRPSWLGRAMPGGSPGRGVMACIWSRAASLSASATSMRDSSSMMPSACRSSSRPCQHCDVLMRLWQLACMASWVHDVRCMRLLWQLACMASWVHDVRCMRLQRGSALQAAGLQKYRCVSVVTEG